MMSTDSFILLNQDVGARAPDNAVALVIWRLDGLSLTSPDTTGNRSGIAVGLFVA